MIITDERLRFELKAAKDGLGRIAATERFTWEGRAACVALSAIQRLEALAMDALNELKGEEMLNVKLKQLSPDAILPEYAKDGDAGMDLRALIPKPIWLQADECKLIPTGIAIYIEDKNYAAFILPRSGLGHKHGLVLGNLVGTIDAPYQGELMVSAWNRSGVAYEIKPQERIAQLVFQRVERVQFEIVDDFAASERGAGGFGSSGKL